MKQKLLILMAFLMTVPLAAQIKFTAEVSKEKLGVNERLRVDFIMNEDGDNFNPPEFEDFTVVGGPNQSISNSWINGKRSFSKTYSYFLAPKRRGQLSIGQAEINIGGNIYKTSPVEVEVTAAVDEPTDGDNTDYVASENLHLVAEVSKTDPYLNEAITIVYKLYVSPRINVSDWRQIDNPSYADFWSQNIDMRQLQVQQGEYQGEPYRYVVLRKTVLYPQKTGKLNIEPLTLSVSVEVPGNRRDIFGNRFYETVEKRVAAGNRTIHVKPLPQEGRPAGFTGAVGSNLDFEVKVDKKKLKATESLEATVEVSGEGNLKLFDLPPLEVPPALEKYEPEYEEDVQTTLEGMEGSISNTYTIIPQKKGKYPVPPLEFSYFDLGTGTYKTLTSEEILLDVDAAPPGAVNPAVSRAGQVVKEKPIVVDQFRYIKLNTNLMTEGGSQFFGSLKFWVLYLAPLLLVPIAILLGRKRRARKGDIRGNYVRRANKLARKYLSDAKRNLGNQNKFYESLERALHNYLKAILHITTSEMSKEKISVLLREKGVDEESIKNYINLLKNCEIARYTPTSNVVMKQDYEKAVRVISEIDKQI